jgi:hypothetical protein
MKNPTRRTGKVVTLIVMPLAVVLAGALVLQASYAAFSGETRNSGNSWSTGTVTLTNDSAGMARFTVPNMTPGQTQTACITVTANATVPGVVKGYTLNPITSTQGLENYIKFTADYGAGGSCASCTGFVSGGNLVTDVPLSTIMLANSYATGYGNWAIAGNVPGGESRTYRFTWTFDTTGLTQAQLDALQGAQTGVDLEWEMQST